MATVIDGNALAQALRADIASKIRARVVQGKRPPGLVTILVGDDPASRVYVARKQRESRDIGMHSESVELPASADRAFLLDTIALYNARPDIDGILVQLPLPSHLDADEAVSAIDPAKDVDGLHPINQGALFRGRPGVLHGTLSYLLQDAHGQVHPAHSISAGLDYPGVGPEHAFLRDSGRVRYESATDAEALDAFQHLSRSEGIIPALESAHALAYLRRLGPSLERDSLVVVNLSGRGDKDVPQVRELLRQAKPSEVSR